MAQAGYEAFFAGVCENVQFQIGDVSELGIEEFKFLRVSVS